jgi:hypothetical protein
MERKSVKNTCTFSLPLQIERGKIKVVKQELICSHALPVQSSLVNDINQVLVKCMKI